MLEADFTDLNANLNNRFLPRRPNQPSKKDKQGPLLFHDQSKPVVDQG